MEELKRSHRQIQFEVEGFPPGKNEALSMLGAKHSQAPRVRTLLQAAQLAIQAVQFVPFEAHDSLGLELIVYAPRGKVPSDATNYLGGIGDALESKDRRGELAHLADLRGVYLYRNDRQIHEVHYRQEFSTRTYYRVRVWHQRR